MDNNKTNLPSKELTSQDVIEFFNDFKPTTKDDSIGAIVKLVPFLDREAKRIKSEATQFLLNKCKDCAVYINSDSTAGVTKIDKYSKVYNDVTLAKLEEDLAAAKKAISARKKVLEALHETGEKTVGGEDIITRQLQTTYFKETKV